MPTTLIDGKKSAKHLSQKCLLGLCGCLRLGCVPDGKAEPNLVQHVCDVVDQVKDIVIDSADKVTEVVAQWVDGPANSDNEAHGVEGGSNIWACIILGWVEEEDLDQDENPASHAHGESSPWVDNALFTQVTEAKHDHCADQQAPEHDGAQVWLDRLEDEVELNHLQWDGERPIYVPVHPM